MSETTNPPESSAGEVTVAIGSAARGLDHPARVGRYQIISVLGEGGMGVVYRAEQTHPVKRTVALKLIKLGLDTRQVVARFDGERQALAMMDHPNVARVFDAGADDLGRPYFVMEYVPGAPLTAFCDQRRLATAQRLELFCQACAAVQHAHQKGIIHRDLKPGNLLVHDVDGRPSVKVNDFGVATATGDRRADHSLATERGQMIGTPEYMSPEQAENGTIEVDTRADVYSLGVILYELLTGRLPFDSNHLRAASLLDIQRMIREVEPARPSTMLLRDTQRITLVAQAQATEPQTLLRALRNDLDWVVMRALEKEPDRRYASVSELAADVQRFLRCEPVVAGPPSRTYRLRKFVRRNRIVVAAGAAVATALVLGAAGMTWQAIRATRAERDARAALASEEEVNDFLTETLESVNPEQSKGKEVSVRQMLDAAAAKLGTELANQPRVEAKLRYTIGKTYDALGRLDDAMPQLQRALELATREFGEDSDTALDALDQMGQILSRRGRFAEAEPLLRRQVELARGRLGAENQTTLYATNTLAVCLQSQERFAEAEPLFRAVIDGLHRQLGSEHQDVLAIEGNFAFLLAQVGRQREAEPILQRLFETHRKVFGPDHPRTFTAQNNFALLIENLGQLPEAQSLYRDALERTRRVNGPDHPSTYLAMANLGNALRLGGERDAVGLLREAMTGIARQLGDYVAPALEARHNLCLALLAAGEAEQAHELARGGYEIVRAGKIESSSPLSLRVRQRYAAVLLRVRGPAAAEPVAREALELAEKSQHANSPATVEIRTTIAEILDAAGRGGEAQRLRASTHATTTTTTTTRPATSSALRTEQKSGPR
jgi:non-specific serine/threonine protein kinase/serine/threonine-protein kinase